MKQKEYLIKVAEKNYKPFLEQGYATAGHNGPHGHLDTPVRNTAHYLIIYSYLFKETGDEKYQRICERFVDYLCQMQSKSQSGAIQCICLLYTSRESVKKQAVRISFSVLNF